MEGRRFRSHRRSIDCIRWYVPTMYKQYGVDLKRERESTHQSYGDVFLPVRGSAQRESFAGIQIRPRIPSSFSVLWNFNSGISLRYIVAVGCSIIRVEWLFPSLVRHANRTFRPILPWLSTTQLQPLPHSSSTTNHRNPTPNTLDSLPPLRKRYRSRLIHRPGS